MAVMRGTLKLAKTTGSRKRSSLRFSINISPQNTRTWYRVFSIYTSPFGPKSQLLKSCTKASHLRKLPLNLGSSKIKYDLEVTSRSFTPMGVTSFRQSRTLLKPSSYLPVRINFQNFNLRKV